MGSDIILCMALIASFFLNNVVKTVAPALGVIDQLPIADTLKKLKGDDKK